MRLYDLPGLVDDARSSHSHLGPVYADLLGIAFGADGDSWAAASPARFEPADIAALVSNGPKLVVLDQSVDDQLVPINQTEKMHRSPTS